MEKEEKDQMKKKKRRTWTCYCTLAPAALQGSVMAEVCSSCKAANHMARTRTPAVISPSVKVGLG
jgi:hypothetical protein